MKIAFGYKMRSGKDTAVDYLITKYGGKKITFAKYLYQSLFSTQEIFNFPIEKDRKYLQIVGDWARNKDKNVFVNLALKEIENNIQNNNFFCNDLRFINEYEKLKSNGWICIKIIRNVTNEQSSHHSENELDNINNWDYIIENNGSLEDFYKNIDDIIKKF